MTSEDLAKGVPAVLKYFAEMLLKQSERHEDVHLYLTGIAFGDAVVIASLPSEPFVEIGLTLRKEIFGDRLCLVAALANGLGSNYIPGGYIPNPWNYGRGGVRNDDRPAPLRIVKDFENGLGDLAFLGDLSQSMKHEIVDDPTSPGKGKVLKITIQPPEATGSDDGVALKELALYMPYRVPAGTVGPFVDYRIVTAAPGDFSHFDDLFLGEGKLDDPQRLYRRGTSRGAPSYWFRNIHPPRADQEPAAASRHHADAYPPVVLLLLPGQRSGRDLHRQYRRHRGGHLQRPLVETRHRGRTDLTAPWHRAGNIWISYWSSFRCSTA